MKKIFAILIASIFIDCMANINLHAQEIGTTIVTGVVTDNLGEPLIGASVSIKGTNINAISDFDGKFSINAPQNAVLQFSFVGYSRQEIAVANRQEINVVMEELTFYRPARPINLTTEQIQKTQNSNSFAFKMFRELSDFNTLFSPFSLNMLLGMLHNGSTGNTRAEIAKTLGMESFTEAEINEYFQKLSQNLLGIDASTDLIIANSIWYNKKDLPIKNSFIETSQKYFAAQVRGHDFSDPNLTEIIDAWCAENTRNKIPSIGIRPNPLDMMYLVNALYFNGTWQNTFERRNTRRENFTLANNRRKRVSMMQQTAWLSYYADQYMQSVELPYGNGAFSMIIILPSENRTINQLIELMDNDKWQNALDNMRTQRVRLKLPRFKIENDFFLRETIKRLGIENIFDENLATFSNIADFPLWVSEIIQKTFVEVNEEGTEAAAASATVIVGASGRARPVEPIHFFADRPFLFLIREKSTGVILFMGRVDEPRE